MSCLGKEKNRHTTDPKYVKLAYTIFVQEKRMEIIHQQIDRYDASLLRPPSPNCTYHIIDLDLVSQQVNHMWQDLSKRDTDNYRARARLETKRRRVANMLSPGAKRRHTMEGKEGPCIQDIPCDSRNCCDSDDDDDTNISFFHVDPTTKNTSVEIAKENIPNVEPIAEPIVEELTTHTSLGLKTGHQDKDTHDNDPITPNHRDHCTNTSPIVFTESSFLTTHDKHESDTLCDVISSLPTDQHDLTSIFPPAGSVSSDVISDHISGHPTPSSVPVTCPTIIHSSIPANSYPHYNRPIGYSPHPYPHSVPHTFNIGYSTSQVYQAPYVPLGPYPMAFPYSFSRQHTMPQNHHAPPQNLFGNSPIYGPVIISSQPPASYYNSTQNADSGRRAGSSSIRDNHLLERRFEASPKKG